MIKITRILAVAGIVAASARGQGFVNLNFASAQNVTNSGMSMPIANALPGWTAYNGPVTLSDALANIEYLTNSAYVGGSVELLGGSAALSGNAFSVYLGPNGAISQTATVTANVESLQFEATTLDNLYVTLGGQSLAYALLSEGPDYDVYGANIPAGLDGQTEALIFGMQGIGQTLLDDIAFSTSSVPEPSACALFGLGALLFVLRRLRQQ